MRCKLLTFLINEGLVGPIKSPIIYDMCVCVCEGGGGGGYVTRPELIKYSVFV